MDSVTHHLPPVSPSAKSKLPEATLKKIDEQAGHFEAMFMSQMLQFMWSGIESNDYFGGGHGEDAWRSQLIQEYGTVSAKAGNLGIGDAVKNELIKLQEKMMPAAPAAGTTTVSEGEKT